MQDLAAEQRKGERGRGERREGRRKDTRMVEVVRVVGGVGEAVVEGRVRAEDRRGGGSMTEGVGRGWAEALGRCVRRFPRMLGVRYDGHDHQLIDLVRSII